MACLGLLSLGLPAFALELSAAERDFVNRQGPVTFCVDPDWQPFEHVDTTGRHSGIAADLLALVAQRTGLTLQLLRTPDWPRSLQASKDGRCQLMSLLNQTPERSMWLDFTQPLLTDDNVLITREEHPFIADLAGLENHTLALPKGTSVEERVRQDFPNIRLVLTDTEAQAMAMVSDRKADMTMRSLIVAAYTIKREGWFNLKIAGQVPDYGNQLRIGVAKGQPVFRSILDQGVASITPVERQQIIDRHITINATTGIDYGPIKQLLGVFALMALTSLFWIRKIKRAKDLAEKAAAEQRQFIAMLSHEVRTPLTVIDAAAQVLLQRLPADSEQLPPVKRIRRGTLRLKHFFDNCLTAERVNSDNFTVQHTPVDLGQLAAWSKETAALLSTDHSIALHVEPGLPTLLGDQVLLRILLINLLSNSLKFSAPNTQVSLRVERRGELCCLIVEDQGPGIAADEIDHIFEKYQRGRLAQDKPGAGLGLALVRRIAALHGGSVSVQSQPGQGARFNVEIPFNAR